MILFIPFLLSHEQTFEGIAVNGREIEGSDEWEPVGENDTIAAGLHVRMDLSTGGKWVKKISSDDENDNVGSVDSSENSDGLSTKVAVVSIDPTGQVDVLEEENGYEKYAKRGKLPSPKDDHLEPKYDFDMMHRTLSKLPDSEKDRVGGLPKLPSVTDYKGKDYEKLRKKFEVRMKEIWVQRQAELQRVQEEDLADFPKILKQWMGVIQEYLNNPFYHLQEIIKNKNDGQNNMNLITVLQELEYQLSDIDMARDFHTLGGWPLLVSLLHNTVHKQPPSSQTQSPLNSTHSIDKDSISDIDIMLTDQEYTIINTIQAYAAWAIGTAVKNTEEFLPYTVEEVRINITDDTHIITTPLDLLLSQLKDTAIDILPENSDQDSSNSELFISAMKKYHKIVYALGSSVRSNRVAQAKLCVPIASIPNIELEGSQIIIDVLKGIISKVVVSNDVSSNGNSKHYYKIVTRIMMLIDDILMDLQLHPQNDINDKLITGAFSTDTVTGTGNESYCDVFLLPFRNIIDDRNIISLQQSALKTINTMASYCFDKSDKKFQGNKKNLQLTFNLMKTKWEQFLKDDDSDVLAEQNQILENILQQLS